MLSVPEGQGPGSSLAQLDSSVLCPAAAIAVASNASISWIPHPLALHCSDDSLPPLAARDLEGSLYSGFAVR